MIIINDNRGFNDGLGKPKWMRKINFKNAVKMAVAPHTLIPKNKRMKLIKLAVAPHTLISKHKRKGVVKLALMPHTLLFKKHK